MMDGLEACHSRLASLIGPDAEPIEVLRCAEEHRAYWRPDHVRVVLLAESHVYTTTADMGHRVVLPHDIGSDVPNGFVRLVYCLGYGENNLLDWPIDIPRNAGTPQFWKIFYSCVNPVNTNQDFSPVQRQTPFQERIRYKLALLRRLKEAGIWLVDTSVAALYLPGRPKPSPKLLEAVLRVSWDMYVGKVVEQAKPMHIICVGKGVAQSLGYRLHKFGTPTVIPQPNAWLPGDEHLQGFQKYYNVVQQVLHGER
jgi:hypothetical protein